MPDVVYLNSRDNVCVAARNLERGESVVAGERTIKLTEPVRQGHKVAVAAIGAGDVVRKWGETIGFATQAIAPGQWVHSHNMAIGELEHHYEKSTDVPPAPPPLEGHTFQGFRRAHGRAGTRNYIAIISGVNCSASVASYVARRFTPEMLRDYANVDGVIAFSHGHGCGMEFGGEHHRILNRVMGGMARH